MSVPYARGSGKTWEGVGVKPTIASHSTNALNVALKRLGLEPASGDIDALSEGRRSRRAQRRPQEGKRQCGALPMSFGAESRNTIS